MKIYVISLRTSYDRRAVMTEQMKRLSLFFEFVDGIDGKSLSNDELSKVYDHKKAYRQEGRCFTKGEIGAALSHLKVYKKIIEENIPYALILEDDAWLTPSIAKVIEAIDQKLFYEINGVFLMQEMKVGSFKKNGNRISIIGDLFFFKEVKSACWAHAYLVTKKAARSLISALTPVAHTADSWGWLIRHQIVNVYCMNRTLSTQNIYDLKSIIGFERFEKNRWFLGSITHKAYRAFWLTYDIFVSIKNRVLQKK